MKHLITLHNKRDRSSLFSVCLMLEALDIFFELYPAESGTAIYVNDRDFYRASEEIEALLLEEKESRAHSSPNQMPENSWNPAVLLTSVLALFHLITGNWSPHATWFLNGALNSEDVLHSGQYYRLVTALTLHASLSHLMANCLFGVFLLHFFFKSTGAGLGFFSLLLSSAIANLANIIVRNFPHSSVGFSTAIFAVLGMEVGISWYHRKVSAKAKTHSRMHAFSSFILPLMASLGLLAFLGTEGEHTDIGAHFFGFLIGLIWGGLLTWGLSHNLQKRQPLQIVLFLTSLLLIFLCWYQALKNF